MNIEFKDDARQVLEILNSLGIVNITAQELKIFLKELKLYRKMIKKNFHDSKIETAKTLLVNNNTYIKNLLDHKSKLLNTLIVHKQQNKQIEDEDKKKCLKTPISKVKNLIEKSKNSKSTIFNKLYTNNQDNIKITNSLHKIKNVSSNNIKKKITFISKPLTTSNNRSQIVIFDKHLINDPVILYNQYKSFWEQLSIPGEDTHAKLRCAVRTKLFNSNSIRKV